MSDHFEDELRATMREHDHEAPAAALPDFRAADGPRVPTGGRYTWLPIAAAAAAVLTLVGITFALGPGENRGAPKAGASGSTTTTTASSPLTCPAKYVDGPNKVPALPTGTVDGNSSLAPNLTPTSVVVCAYLHPTGTKLTGDKVLGGDLSGVANTLAWLPTGTNSDRYTCPAYLAATDSDNYLFGLTYSIGTVWISAPGNHCDGASNGYFRTSTNLRAYAESSYMSGRWTQTDKPWSGACSPTTLGRLGDDKSMVPGTPTSVTICTVGLANPLRRTTTDIAALVRALNGLPTLISSRSCPNQRHVPNYELRFDYALGPPVWVGVTPYCRPAIDNGAIQALDGSNVAAVIADLLK